MADWEIKAVSRDPTGNILAYCGDEPFAWTVWVHDLVDDIEGGRHTYYVSGPYGARVDVVASLTGKGKIVRTHPDAGPDLIARLPRC